MFDAGKVRKDFPFLDGGSGRKQAVYFDNAATTQKPRQILQAISEYYGKKNANPHRGIYELSELATEAYEGARKKTAGFINAKPSEIVFTKNTTEGINLIKTSFAHALLKKGDRVLISIMEHHSNIVPWQMLERQGIGLDYIEITEEGRLEENWEKRITPKTKMVCITHASNVLGTINNTKEICAAAAKKGCTTLVDGAQAAPHFKVDVKKIGCDFYVFSGHKMLAPMGIGVLYGRRELLEKMPPFLGGGDMILSVDRHKSEWNDVPWKFEAGTPNVEAAVGLDAALDYLQKLGMESIHGYEQKMTSKALAVLQEFKKVKVLGPKNASERTGLVAFAHEKIHAHDLTSIMSEQGIAIRSGHHCAMPLHKTLGLAASARASFYIYNTLDEVELLAEALENAEKAFGMR